MVSRQLTFYTFFQKKRYVVFLKIYKYYYYNMV